ncbi:MAG: hypothetical protein IJU48_08960 [Synergistaceae bacterium]|nr:hypothetical protein [Synergistaceae bacterium]
MNNNLNVKAVIDIGSNSIKLTVGQLDENGNLKILLDNSEIVQIRKGFINGHISEEKIKQASDVISQMVQTARDNGADFPCLVGTMAMRQALNADEFQNSVYENTGLRIRILSGTEEANYSWRGAVESFSGEMLNDKDIVMFDTGGGSTEFVFGRGLKNIRSQSLPIGAITVTEKFLSIGPISQHSINNAVNFIRRILAENDIKPIYQSEPLIIGLGGGVTAMASVKRGDDNAEHESLNGMILTRQDLQDQIKLFAPLTLEERKKIPGLPPKRADVITSTACTVSCILEALNAGSCTLSLRGLRHAILKDLLTE